MLSGLFRRGKITQNKKTNDVFTKKGVLTAVVKVGFEYQVLVQIQVTGDQGFDLL